MLEVPDGTTRTKGNVHHFYKVWNVMRDLYPTPTPTSSIYQGETGKVPGVLIPPPSPWGSGPWGSTYGPEWGPHGVKVHEPWGPRNERKIENG